MPKSLKIFRDSKGDCTFEYTDFRLPVDIALGDVLIRSKYASLNYKDFLVSAGDPGLVRRYPHTPGIDVSGIVVSSKHPNFKEGDLVCSIGTSLGISCNGSFSELVLIPGDWLFLASSMLDLRNSMMLGTSGVTASLVADLILSIQRRNGLDKSIIITAPRSSVSSFLLRYLDSLDYRITLLQRASGSKQYDHGCCHIPYSTLSLEETCSAKCFPLRRSCFSFAIDLLGGNVTQYMLSSLNPGGALLSVGGILSASANLSLLPFYLRGVQVIGINTESRSHEELRSAVARFIQQPQVMDERHWRTVDFFELGSILTSPGHIKSTPHTLVEFR